MSNKLQKRLQRAPSTICLLCATCRRRVTPCLVCAHLLPCCCCFSSWLACRRCNVKNPIQDEERRLLGFPPASALPISMVRRVLIAYIGRPSCTLATRLHLQRLQQALAGREEQTALGSKGATNDKEPCIQFKSSFEEIELSNLSQIGVPFMQCEGIVENAAVPLQNRISNANEGTTHLLLEGNSNAGDSCNECSGSCKLACLNEGMVENLDTALRRCQEQLVALHCVEAFSADLTASTYPLCNTVIRSSLRDLDIMTFNTKIGCDCSSGLGKGFSIGMLHMVNSGFVEDFEVWLTKKVETSQESCKFEDILKNVEVFREKQEQSLDLQRSVLKAVGSHKQVAIDGKAVMQSQSLYSTVCMLEQFFADREKERIEKVNRVVVPFMSLLHQINLVLEFLYGRSHSTTLFPHPLSFRNDARMVSGCMVKVSSDRHLQTAVSYWLLLYHDVVHAIALI